MAISVLDRRQSRQFALLRLLLSGVFVALGANRAQDTYAAGDFKRLWSFDAKG